MLTTVGWVTTAAESGDATALETMAAEADAEPWLNALGLLASGGASTEN